MFNLLPTTEKKSIESAYVAKRYQLFFLFLLITLIAATIFLVPSFIAAKYGQKEALTELESIKTSLSDNDQELSHQLTNGHNKISALNQEVVVKPSEIIATVVSKRGTGIKIKSVFYQKQNNGTSTLAVGGVANTRDNLLLFVENLKEDPDFDNVTFPVSNFAKDRDIDFNVDIILK